MLNEILTPKQQARAKHIVKEGGPYKANRIIVEVLGDLDPPENVEREFDRWSRVQTYSGYKPSHIVSTVIEKYSSVDT